MSPILGIWASQISGHLWAPSGAYDALGAVTLSATTAEVVITVPTGYRDIELRWSATTNRGTYGIDDMFIRLNGDSGSNYSYHFLTSSNGSTPTSSAGSSASYMYFDCALGTTVANIPGVGVLNIKDYLSTNKNKTVRALTGTDLNGAIATYYGRVAEQSGAWYNTSAVTSMTIGSLNGGSFVSGSKFEIYGVK